MSRSFVRVSLSFALLATTACTQPAATVDLKGQNSYTRNGTSEYNTASYSGARNYSAPASSYSRPAPVYSAPVPQNTSQSASVQSIGVSDLSPPDKQARKDSFDLRPQSKKAGKGQMISQIDTKDKPVAQLDTIIGKDDDSQRGKEVKLTRDATPPGKNAGGFMWPVNGKKVVSGFGPKGGGKVNDGINIASSEGEPVFASADGEVLYVGNELQGYGNMVIIKHAGNKSTTYAHLNGYSVDKYERVKQGDIIGYVGSTGNVKSPQLHFAIRDGKEPLDPRKFLSSNVAGL